jgi:hypothetical protein
MKKLLLPVALSLIASHVQAGDDVIAFTRSSVGVLRSSGNLYRPAPRGGSFSNLSASDRYRAVIYRPTQHFYLKDNIVSYRYSAQDLSVIGSEYGGNYHGPHSAQFIPSMHQMAPHGRMRSYASVNKRPQPGVPMISRTTKITTTAAVEAPVTTLQMANVQ